jgi:hypothetical protein
MEVEELGKILFFVGLLIVLVLLISGMGDKLFDLFDKFKNLLFFR